jgi:hypothetical protein
MWDDTEIRRKAAFDLSCGEADIQYTFLDTMNRGVTGCGSKITYKYDFNNGWFSDTAQRTR